MALDEALLEDAAASGNASLRLYQWREPTLSLGYFQPYDERLSHAASREAAVVRRLSGGGALLHDRELTYSLCLPAGHSLARHSADLYAAVHSAIIQVLARWGLNASLHGDRPAGDPAPSEPFLCFARRTSADVVLRGPRAQVPPVKIVGSAQRRRRGAVLQHGAILLDASPAAPELAGVNGLGGDSITPAALVEPLRQALAESLGLRFYNEPLSGELRENAQRLQREKFAHRSWTQRR